MEWNMLNWDFRLPTRVRFGWGRLAEVRDVVRELGGRKVFLVSSAGYNQATGTVDRLSGLIDGMPLQVFDEVEENPSIATVDRGAKLCRETDCDIVVALGGGSPLDAAKAIAMLQRNEGSVREYLDQARVCSVKGLPMIAIPTTSGTGSEVTPFSVITHPEKQSKPAIAPVQNFPDVALVDPELTLSMPSRVAASTGLDALCQGIEGFWSTRASDATRAFSFRGIVLAMRNLESACIDKDRVAVTNMALASNLVGIQMAMIGNTAIHPLSYPVTMDHHVAHGFACSLFLPPFLRFNAEMIRDMFADLLAVLDLKSVEALADRIEGMMERLAAPCRLSDVGADASTIPSMVKRGIGKSTEWNPKKLAEADIIKVCEMVA